MNNNKPVTASEALNLLEQIYNSPTDLTYAKKCKDRLLQYLEQQKDLEAKSLEDIYCKIGLYWINDKPWLFAKYTAIALREIGTDIDLECAERFELLSHILNGDLFKQIKLLKDGLQEDQWLEASVRVETFDTKEEVEAATLEDSTKEIIRKSSWYHKNGKESVYYTEDVKIILQKYAQQVTNEKDAEIEQQQAIISELSNKLQLNGYDDIEL